MSTALVQPGVAALSCPVCKDPMTAGQMLTCQTCETPVHEICFNEMGGCVRFACPEAASPRRRLLKCIRVAHEGLALRKSGVIGYSVAVVIGILSYSFMVASWSVSWIAPLLVCVGWMIWLELEWSDLREVIGRIRKLRDESATSAEILGSMTWARAAAVRLRPATRSYHRSALRVSRTALILLTAVYPWIAAWRGSVLEALTVFGVLVPWLAYNWSEARATLACDEAAWMFEAWGEEIDKAIDEVEGRWRYQLWPSDSSPTS